MPSRPFAWSNGRMLPRGDLDGKEVEPALNGDLEELTSRFGVQLEADSQ